jgi:hypothetical protein
MRTIKLRERKRWLAAGTDQKRERIFCASYYFVLLSYTENKIEETA